MSNFNTHVMQRPGKCRGCNSRLEVKQEVLYTYTTAGQGMGLYFCDECQLEMAMMTIRKYDSLEDFGEQMTMRKLEQ